MPQHEIDPRILGQRIAEAPRPEVRRRRKSRNTWVTAGLRTSPSRREIVRPRLTRSSSWPRSWAVRSTNWSAPPRR